MGLKNLEKHVRGWFPKEPNVPSSSVKAAEVPTKTYKVLWYVVVFSILTFIVASVILFYVPFLQQGAYGFTTGGILVIVNVLAAYLVHKKVLPKPSSRERILNLVFLAIVAIIALVIWLVIGGK